MITTDPVMSNIFFYRYENSIRMQLFLNFYKERRFLLYSRLNYNIYEVDDNNFSSLRFANLVIVSTYPDLC